MVFTDGIGEFVVPVARLSGRKGTWHYAVQVKCICSQSFWFLRWYWLLEGLLQLNRQKARIKNTSLFHHFDFSRESNGFMDKKKRLSLNVVIAPQVRHKNFSAAFY